MSDKERKQRLREILDEYDHAPSVFEWLDEELRLYADQDAVDNSMRCTIEMLMGSRSDFGGVDNRKALLRAIPEELVTEWLKLKALGELP